jgi:hypothetical protein
LKYPLRRGRAVSNRERPRIHSAQTAVCFRFRQRATPSPSSTCWLTNRLGSVPAEPTYIIRKNGPGSLRAGKVFYDFFLHPGDSVYSQARSKVHHPSAAQQHVRRRHKAHSRRNSCSYMLRFPRLRSRNLHSPRTALVDVPGVAKGPRCRRPNQPDAHTGDDSLTYNLRRHFRHSVEIAARHPRGIVFRGHRADSRIPLSSAWR